jgi:hypothetical protein
MASRRNRRPRICPLCVDTPVAAKMNALSFLGAIGDNFAPVGFDTVVSGSVDPPDRVANQVTLAINGVAEGVTGFFVTDDHEITVEWSTPIVSGDTVDLTIPPDCYAFVGIGGEFVNAVELSFGVA